MTDADVWARFVQLLIALRKTSLLIQLLDGLIQALVCKLLVLGLGRLPAHLSLQSLHVGLVAKQDHLEKVGLRLLHLFHVEAHLFKLLLK